MWAALPAASELGAHSYADTLYGRSPRCCSRHRTVPTPGSCGLGEHTGDEAGLGGGERDQRRKVARKITELTDTITGSPLGIPSSFVAVTGRGPRDSNESGKTSFNAAVALLLGDAE
jgi:hypothetical protein